MRYSSYIVYMIKQLKNYKKQVIVELENDYPGPYYIYEFETYPNKYNCSIGVTRNPSMENKKQARERLSSEKLCLPKVLFEVNDLYTAALKEREIKAMKGIPYDTTDYINDLLRQRVSCSKEVRKKAVANTDLEKKFNKSVRAKMRQAKSWKFRPVKAYKVEKASSAKNSKIISEEYYATYNSLTSATKATGVTPQDISQILNPKLSAKSRKGWTFRDA
jgi:hypothetical protein